MYMQEEVNKGIVMKNRSFYAKKSADKAVARGCKRIGFYAEEETQKKLIALQEIAGVKQYKEIFEKLINDAYRNIA